MKIKILFSELSQNIQVVLRRAGYQLYRTQGSELVFSRRLSRTNFFPRFHLYLHQTSAGWEGNLHYDLRQTVQANPVHGEEYEGEIVEEEYQRLNNLIHSKNLTPPESSDPIQLSGGLSRWSWLIVISLGIIILVIILS